MARPPSVVPAPTLEAYYMRAYRAWRAGRGVCPGSRSHYIAAAEAVRERQDRTDGEREWSELRSRVLALGGVRSTVDYSVHEIPRAVYRRDGKAPDVMAQLLGFDSDADLVLSLRYSSDRARRAAAGVRPVPSMGERDYSQGGAW